MLMLPLLDGQDMLMRLDAPPLRVAAEKPMPGVELIDMPHPGTRTDTRTAMTSDGHLYVAETYNNDGGWLWCSKDRGETWDMRRLGLPSRFGGGGFGILADDTFIMVADPRSEYCVYRSTDRGETWAEPITLDRVGFHQPNAGWMHIFQHPDGSAMIVCPWLQDVDRRDVADRRSGLFECIYRSADSGQTWQGPTVLTRHGTETSLLALNNGEMLALTRAQRMRSEDDPLFKLEMVGLLPDYPDSGITLKNGVVLRSEDGGQTWQEPMLLTDYGDVPGELIQTPDGRVAAIWLHRYPHPTGRVLVRISEDDGRTWSDTVYTLFHGNGYPSSVVYDDGLIVTVCENTKLDEAGHPIGDRSMVAARWRMP